jgi:glucoamylase
LVRYGIRRADDPLIVDSLKVVDHLLKVETPRGTCWKRYNHDGYGQRADGGPYLGWGQGRPWPLLTGERAHYELAAGRDVTQYVTSIEKFSSAGGMLPEQIWDQPDSGKNQLNFGGPTGSAMPLVWAHAEYLKLLRSVTDGQVFDRIAAVEVRYCRRRRKNAVEIFRLNRQIESIQPGKRLRVLAEERFEIVWSSDNWQTVHTTGSRSIGNLDQFADIQTLPDQSGQLSFTFHWLDQDRWQGRNFEVRFESVVPGPPVQDAKTKATST